MEHIQLSLFGKTSWELFHQITGWILKPCWNRSQKPIFQCLLLESGQSAGMVRGKDVELCWRVLDARYWGKPTLAQRRRRIFLVADFGGTRAREILFKTRHLQLVLTSCEEDRLSSTSTGRIFAPKKKGGKYPSSDPFKKDACEAPQKTKIKQLPCKFWTDK